MMDKIDLDRNFKLKEKMELLWANDTHEIEENSLASTDKLQIDSGEYTCPTPDSQQPAPKEE
jgi:hypothetical protein